MTLAISWRFTIPHRNTVISEIENLWAHPVGVPLAVPEPRPEREPLTVGTVALNVGLDCVVFMDDGVFNPAEIDDILKPRAYTEGGPELLTDGEATLVKRLMRALVDGDRDVLDEVGAFVDDRDPYMWTHEYGRFGHVHFAMPPVEFSEWDVSVLHVDDRPGESQVIVGMWTREEGASDLSLEIILNTDATSGVVRGEFDNLHVM